MQVYQKRTFIISWVCSFLINVAWGVTFPLKNIYIHDQAISLVQIGTLSTAGAVAFCLGGILLGHLSDRVGNRRTLIIASLAGHAVVTLAYLRAQVYVHFLLLSLMDWLLIAGYMVLMDAQVTSIFAADKRGSGYGSYRISGSLGFAIAGFALGMITGDFGIRSIFIVGAVALSLAGLIAVFLQEDEPKQAIEAESVDVFKPKILQTIIASGLIWMFLANFISHVGDQVGWPFKYIYIKEAMGVTAGTIGLLSTIGVMFEIPAMLGLGRLSDKYGRQPILLFGYLAIAASWLLLYLASDLTLILFVNPLVGLSIVRYSVGVSLISDRAPSGQLGTLLGLFALTSGLGGIIGPTVGGEIAEKFGMRNIFLMAFILGGLACLLYVVIIRIQPARPLSRK
jgi:PPP family 3-phenylpropionic acid transporter